MVWSQDLVGAHRVPRSRAWVIKMGFGPFLTLPVLKATGHL